MLHQLLDRGFDNTPRQISDVAEYLCVHLGDDVTAYISGIEDPELVHAWAQGSRVPGAEERARLEAAFEASKRLVPVCGDRMTRSWFFGTNRALGNTAPAYVLRYRNQEDRASVISAAQVFAEI
jgi:hypothetical protein